MIRLFQNDGQTTYHEKKEQSLQDLKLKKIHEKNVVIKTMENFFLKRNTLLKIKATI